MAYLPRLLPRTVLAVLLVLLAPAAALAADITAVRSWRAPDNTRLVFDLTGPVRYRLSPDSTPARLVVEIEDARPAGPLALPAVQAPLKSLRLEPTASGQRLVVETALELMPKVFQLPPNEKYGHRLVLDLFEKPSPVPDHKAVAGSALGGAVAVAPGQAPVPVVRSAPAAPAPEVATARPAEPSPAPADAGKPPVEPAAADKPAAEKPLAGKAAAEKPAPSAAPEPAAPEKYDARRFRNIVVAIDAGHGGEDPGAIGQAGTYEKHVTLAIARELKERLEAEPGITAVLTRTGDYFLPLQERRRLARYQHKADIFVSIHADAAENRAARGASVFALSLKGAGSATSRFARMLAERENRADLIGGAALESEDNVLRNVLADMVVAGSLEHSLHMGRHILSGLGRLAHLHSRQVEQAGFAVLKEPGMVSLLVETGFISNPEEERKLISRQYQQELADAIAAGVRRYCMQYPAPATYFAWLADRGRDGGRARPAVATPAPATAAATPAATEAPAPVLATAAPAPAREAAVRYRTHRVERGENLTRLADRYGVSMDRLREANQLRDDNLRIGQRLKIPVN